MIFMIVVRWWGSRETCAPAGRAVVLRDLKLIDAFCQASVLQSRLPAGCSTRYDVHCQLTGMRA